MQRIVVNMQNFVFSDTVKRALKDEGDFNVSAISNPLQVVDQCQELSANLVLLEVTSYTPWKLEERMEIRKELQHSVPKCKIVFFVDEKAEKEIAGKIKQAKRDGLIDQFIFGSSSADFMVALLDTM